MLKFHKHIFVFAIISTLCVLVSPVIAAEKSSAPQKPKYIFLMIGDGMGSAQRAAAEMYKCIDAGAAQGDKKGKLIMNQFPVKGLTTTYPVDKKVTDSAAAGTALACGEKTKNGVVGMSPDLSKKLKSVAYYAQDADMKVGIVSNVPIDHATPACFYAREPKRGNYYEIAIQVPQSGFNYFAGGAFIGARSQNIKGQKNPRDCARQGGYTIYKGRDGLGKIKPGDDQIIWEADIPFVIDSTPDTVTLAELTRKGIEILDNPNGFFMMVEGGKIDWACHANDSATAIRETLAFDDAIVEVYEFYKKHPDETLIVVTADHETGGMQADFAAGFSPGKFIAAVKSQKISGGAFAKKTQAWNSDNITKEEALKKIVEYFGFQDLTSPEKADLSRAIEGTLKYKKPDDRPAELKRMYGSKNMIMSECLNIVAKHCGVTWSTYGHTGAAVPTTAIGVGAEDFTGKTDNTDIAKKLITLIQQPANHKGK